MSQATVLSIHLARGSRLPMVSVPSVFAETNMGLVGDRYHGAPLRQVTLQAAGELAEAAAEAELPIEGGRTRRNITISATALPRTAGHRITIGNVELEVARDAAPCQRMEEIFGSGAREAMKGRAGIGCKVIRGGEIAVGDAVVLGVVSMAGVG